MPQTNSQNTIPINEYFLLCTEIYPGVPKTLIRVPSKRQQLQTAQWAAWNSLNCNHMADLCRGLRNEKWGMIHTVIINIVSASWHFPAKPWYALGILGPANATHISCIHCHIHPADDALGRCKHLWVLIIPICPLQSTFSTGLPRFEIFLVFPETPLKFVEIAMWCIVTGKKLSLPPVLTSNCDGGLKRHSMSA